ncbi:hypothetical protein ABK040_007638 [Willaertia magna]
MSPIPQTETFNFNEFENKLNNDEKKIILSFLDISSLCNVNCVSKSFSLSQLSNDDLFWKDHYKKIITEYYKSTNTNIYTQLLYNQHVKETEEKITTILQSTTQDYKNEIVKFIKEIIKNTQKIQKERLSKMKYNENTTLQNKESLLQNASIIMEEHKHNRDCKMVIVGSDAVGKTCVLMVLSGNYENTKNLDYIPTAMPTTNRSVYFNNNLNEEYKISLWDIGYFEVNDRDRLRPLIYPDTDIFLLCFSLVNFYSFENIADKWVHEIQHHCPNTPFILCGTKVDLRENKKILFHSLQRKNSSEYVPISKEEGEALAKMIGAIAYIETSSFDCIGFDNLAEYIFLLSKVGKQQKEEKEHFKSEKKCLIQ